MKREPARGSPRRKRSLDVKSGQSAEAEAGALETPSPASGRPDAFPVPAVARRYRHRMFDAARAAVRFVPVRKPERIGLRHFRPADLTMCRERARGRRDVRRSILRSDGHRRWLWPGRILAIAVLPGVRGKERGPSRARRGPSGDRGQATGSSSASALAEDGWAGGVTGSGRAGEGSSSGPSMKPM